MGPPNVSSHARLSAQDGFGLIEVLVSALVVVVISLAVLGSMDSASRASGTGKAKAVAADLARQDQERMQGLRPADLMSLDTTRTESVSADGIDVDYTVRSEGEYVLEPATGSGCTSSRRDEYLRVVSTVSWPAMSGVRPVRVESLIAPPLDARPGRGSAVLKILRADGTTPVVGQSVDLVGPEAGRQATGDEGCAFFANYLVGSYVFRFGTAGWVDPNGDEQVSLPIAITGQELASLETLYDRAGAILNARFMTLSRGAGPTTTRADRLTVSHPGIQRSGGQRSVATKDGGLRADMPGLFPFTSPYTVFSGGQCGKALPPALATIVDAGGRTATHTIEPGVTYDGSIVVFEPALDPTVRALTSRNGRPRAVPLRGARVLVRSTDPACPVPVVVEPTENDGRLAAEERGFPYGEYTLCAEFDDRGNWNSSGWSTPVKNDAFSGTELDLDVPDVPGPQRCAP